MPHINPELLKKRKGGKLVPIVQPKTKVAKSPKKGKVSVGKVNKESKASPRKKKIEAKSADGEEAGKGITVLSEKTLFLGQKV